jgi:hypothetical protein
MPEIRTKRVWAMPNRWTFQIPPVADLLSRYIGDGLGWADPFAGKTSPAEITNDLNPELKTAFHLEASEFAERLKSGLKGILFDPPYSFRQIKECYKGVGRTFTKEDSQQWGRWTKLKNILAPKVIEGGYVISCGWNTSGFGAKRSFEIVEILLVAHGGGHNDTLVTVEKRFKSLVS